MSKVTIQEGLDHFRAERCANIDALRSAARAAGDKAREARVAWAVAVAAETRARDEWDAAEDAYTVADDESRALLAGRLAAEEAYFSAKWAEEALDEAAPITDSGQARAWSRGRAHTSG